MFKSLDEALIPSTMFSKRYLHVIRTASGSQQLKVELGVGEYHGEHLIDVESELRLQYQLAVVWVRAFLTFSSAGNNNALWEGVALWRAHLLQI